MSQTLFENLLTALRSASTYNANDQIPPVCVLWTDKDGQWQTLIPLLVEQLPIFELGEYEPESRRGPAYWLRCVIAGMFSETYSPEQGIPILYLPGVSRQDLRAIEDCPKALQPLAELQYRGVFWSQKNGRDWTIAAFLQSKDGGLGLEVSSDQATRDAMLRALPRLAGENLETLQQNAPLKAAYFDTLLHPDEIRSLLLWINNPAGFQQDMGIGEWDAFLSTCQQKYKFHPEKDGALNAALSLGERAGKWGKVWDRYKETPASYPKIPNLLRQVYPEQPGLFDKSETWPQDNETAEEELRDALSALSQQPAEVARQRIHEMEDQHGFRRDWVWARLGLAPLAVALDNLAHIASETQRSLSAPTIENFSQAYKDWGSRIDLSVMQTLAQIQSKGNTEDVKAVLSALGAIYRPWLEQAALSFQQVIQTNGYLWQVFDAPKPGICILFSDALRMDLAHWLESALHSDGFSTTLETYLAALPPITSTSKPSIVLQSDTLIGGPPSTLNPSQKDRESSLTSDLFRKLLNESNIQTLSPDELGDPTGMAWTEIGAIDAYGHQHGIKLALNLQNELNAIKNRSTSLIEHGWEKVIIVTDHGWLLSPGGLPKTHLPEHLTEVRKGRCARLKPGAQTDQQQVPWHWDANVSVAYAPGISCYEAGKEYEHGGLSPQECITPILTVSAGSVSGVQPKILASHWRGLRCTVEVEAATPGMKIDLRLRAGDPSTSIIITSKDLEEELVSLVVEDDDKLGEQGYLVILDASDQVLAQSSTIVGG